MRTPYAVRGARLPPSGFTLLEVIVVMVILGLIMGTSTLAFVSLRARRESNPAGELRRARSEGIQAGRPVSIGGNHSRLTTHVLFLPDGRAVGLGADPLTGTPVDAPQ